MKSLEVNKPIHIGETVGLVIRIFIMVSEGSKATDEYKEGLYYQTHKDTHNFLSR
jgi:hypothetical protein